MNLTTRRKEIMDILQRDKIVEISILSEHFNVSPMTIRRDLLFFEKQGLVTMTHGGAVINEGASIEPALDIKQGQAIQEKKLIGEAAAKLVKEGQAIFIDCGTTTKEVATAIYTYKNITVLTNSLLVANILTQSRYIKLVMLPGTFRDKSMGFVGPSTINFIEKLEFDICFLGTEGVHINRGATVPDLEDGEAKKSIVNRSKKVVVVADNTKIGKSSLVTTASTDDISTIVTGKTADKYHLDKFREKGIEVILV